MKFKIGDLILDNASFSKTDGMLIIETDDKVNPFEVVTMSYEQDTIECVYDDESVETFKGEFTLKHFEQYEGMVKYCISFPTQLEKAEKKIKELTDALTNVELALCEIYESMEV